MYRTAFEDFFASPEIFPKEMIIVNNFCADLQSYSPLFLVVNANYLGKISLPQLTFVPCSNSEAKWEYRK